VLWQYATESDNPCEMAVLAVVLADRRTVSGGMRYRDHALGEFGRLTKERLTSPPRAPSRTGRRDFPCLGVDQSAPITLAGPGIGDALTIDGWIH
jgi:hypothetical protein